MPSKAEAMSYRETREDRVQIQFRLGEALVAKVDAAAEVEQCTRNDWLVEACTMKLAGKGQPGAFLASEVTAGRIPILFRVGKKIKKAIDKDWQGHRISSRTMWIVEAILARLSNYEFSH
jgi:sporulation-control protein spo0M